MTTDSNQHAGFAIYCSTEAVIKEIIKDQIGLFYQQNKIHDLFQLFSDSDQSKVQRFLEAIQHDRAAIDWEINIEMESEPRPLHFSGAMFGDKMLIVGSTSHEHTVSYMEELMKMNNKQINDIRRRMKNDYVNKKSQTDELYQELSRLNNDLATAQRKIEKKNAELEQLNEIKDEFMGMAAHDLRNPLGVIQSLSELLLDDDLTATLTEEQREYINRIHESSQFMSQLVEDLLEVNKIEAGKLNLSPQKVDVNKLIQRNISLNTKTAQEKDINISFEVEPSIPTAELDPNKIEQVLNNLISNAIKYSYRDSNISIRCYKKHKWLHIEVEDQGTGIPADEQEKVFQPFGTTSNKTTGNEQSTGLGLSITKRIVEGHGGEIWVESEIEHGSIFHVKLPINQNS